MPGAGVESCACTCRGLSVLTLSSCVLLHFSTWQQFVKRASGPAAGGLQLLQLPLPTDRADLLFSPQPLWLPLSPWERGRESGTPTVLKLLGFSLPTLLVSAKSDVAGDPNSSHMFCTCPAIPGVTVFPKVHKRCFRSELHPRRPN